MKAMSANLASEVLKAQVINHNRPFLEDLGTNRGRNFCRFFEKPR